MKKVTALLVLLISISAPPAAFAHVDHDDEHPQNMTLSVASKKDGARVTVTKGGVKVPTAGATGKITYTSGKVKKEIALQPSGDNVMETAKTTGIAAGTKAHASVTLADKSVVTTEFVAK